MDILGTFLKKVGGINFKGKGRILTYWINNRNKSIKRKYFLNKKGYLICDFNVPYEAMVWLGYEEKKDLAFIGNILKPGMNFIDCGANIGLYTVMAAYSIGKEGNVYSFEPNPNTANKLLNNIRENNLTNVTTIVSALGEYSGEGLFKCEEAHNISSITNVSSPNTINVSIVTIDQIINDKSIDGIKIDVEGAELEVLKGGKNTLSKNKPWLCIEFNTIVAGVSTLGNWDVHKFLISLGYEAHLIPDKLEKKLEILPDIWQTSGYCNIIYLFKSKQ